LLGGENLHHDLVVLEAGDLDGEDVAGADGRRERRRDAHPGDVEEIGQPVRGEHPRLHDRPDGEETLQRLRVGGERRELGVDQRGEIRDAGGERVDAHRSISSLRREVDQVRRLVEPRSFVDVLFERTAPAALARLLIPAAPALGVGRNVVPLCATGLGDALLARLNPRGEGGLRGGLCRPWSFLGALRQGRVLRRLPDRSLNIGRAYRHGCPPGAYPVGPPSPAGVCAEFLRVYFCFTVGSPSR
jgi:hypothetical protein